MEPQYQGLVAALIPNLHAGWSQAKIEVRVADDHTDLQFAQVGAGGKLETFVPDVERRLKAREALRELRLTMRHDDHSLWSHCTFTLFPDGQFKFDVSYDD